MRKAYSTLDAIDVETNNLKMDRAEGAVELRKQKLEHNALRCE